MVDNRPDNRERVRSLDLSDSVYLSRVTRFDDVDGASENVTIFLVTLPEVQSMFM